MRRPFSLTLSLLFTAVITLVIVAACADWTWTPVEDGSLTEPSGPVSEAQRESRALSIPITLYPSSSDGVPKIGGKSPFGIMVGYPSYATVNYCSVSHLRSRKVALAAHCIRYGTQAGDYFFVFHDRFGKKKITQGKSILYRGNSSADDVTIMEVDSRADDWDVTTAKVEDTSTLITEQLGVTALPATLWSFDPEYRSGERTMSFHPRHCKLFRPLPKIETVTHDGVGVDTSTAFKVKYPPERTVYLDECSAETMGGNSGALITARDDLNIAYGVYDGSTGMQDSWTTEYKQVTFWGSSGKELIFTLPGAIHFFDYGVPLEYVEKNAPGIL